MFPSIDISDTSIYNPNPNPNLNPNPNPNNLQEHDTPPLLFSHFPSPFLDDHTDFFSPQHHHHHIFNNDEINNIFPNTLATDQSQPSISLSPPPDPPLKKMRKDRHSKIFTAQGVRARRMRLPLQIARKFFDLQDMLGFDKASNTIEWLMAKSKGAIKEITRNIPSSTSEKGDYGSNSSDSSEGEKKKRELREKARARARERTREKMMMRSTAEKMTQLGSSSSNPNSSFDSSSYHQSLNKQFSNVGIDADFSVPIFDHENILGGLDYNNSNNLLEFLENWDVENERIGY